MDPTRAGPLHAMALAIQAQLRRFFPEAQFAHALVPDQADPAVWRELTRRTPFLGLSWRGLAPDPASGRILQGQVQWGLSLITKHSRVEGRILGDAASPGLLNMVWIAALALHGQTLADAAGAPLGTISVTGCSNAYANGWGDGQLAIADLTLGVPLPSPGELLADGLQEFLEMGVTWAFPEGDAMTETVTVRAAS